MTDEKPPVPVPAQKPKEAKPAQSMAARMICKIGQGFGAGPRARWRRGLRWVFTAALGLLFLFAVDLRVQQTRGSSPYPRHVDEPFIFAPATRIVRSGDLNPKAWNYPSLPIYLAAAGLGFGSFKAASHKKFSKIDKAKFGYPHYSNPITADLVKNLWGLMVVFSFLFVSLILKRLTGSFVGPLFVGLLLIFDPLAVYLARYVNVDTCATFMALAALFQLSARKKPGDFVGIAIIPGVLIGLATSSKYTYAVLLLSGALGVLFWAQTHRLRHLFALVFATVLTFALTSPYAILDLPAFINGLGAEVRHYATGHTGYEGNPGLAQASKYTTRLLADYGKLSVLPAFAGLLFLLLKRPRQTMLVFLSAVLLIYLICQQRVVFPRNLLLVWYLYPLLIGAGLFAALPWGLRRWGRRWERQLEAKGLTLARRRILARTLPSVLALFFLLLHFFGHGATKLLPNVDTRTRVVAMANEKLPKNATLITPAEVGLYRGGLRKDIKIKVIRNLGKRHKRVGSDKIRTEIAAAYQAAPGTWVIRPRWGADKRYGGRGNAKHLNALWSSLELKLIHQGGVRSLLVNYAPRVGHGDPYLEFGRLLTPPVVAAPVIKEVVPPLTPLKVAPSMAPKSEPRIKPAEPGKAKP